MFNKKGFVTLPRTRSGTSLFNIVSGQRSFRATQAQCSSVEGLSPASGQFTSSNPSTAELMRAHGYLPDNCLCHRIPWGDQDSYGHVNNVKYVHYFETSRVNYFDILASGYKDFPGDFMRPKGLGPVLRKTDVDFRSQLVRNDVIAMQHKITEIKNTSFLLEGIMIHEGRQEVVCTAKEVLVMYDFPNRRKAVIPEGWRNLFQQRHLSETRALIR